MTEAESEWHSCNDASLMLRSIRGRSSVRKFRLCAAACCRRIDHLLLPTRYAPGAVVLAEQMADGLKESPAISEFRDRLWYKGFEWIDGFRKERLNNAYACAAGAALDALQNEDVFLGLSPRPPYSVDNLTQVAAQAASAVAHWQRQHDEDQVKEEDHRRELAAQVPLVKDVFGNPFRPTPVLDSAWLAWRGGTVANLARAAYDDRRLPEGTLESAHLVVLADALEDAGCADANLLGHLRGPGPHVRGCWVVDLILGKHESSRLTGGATEHSRRRDVSWVLPGVLPDKQ